MPSDADFDALMERVATLEGKLQALDAHGLTALQFGNLNDHPVRYSTSVPTTADMTSDGQIRAIHTGGNDYLYARSNGTVKRVQIT